MARKENVRDASTILEGDTLKLMGDWRINGNIPNNVTFKVQGNLILEGTVGNHAHITVSDTLTFNKIGDRPVIVAGRVRGGNVGDNGSIYSTEDGVTLHNIGEDTHTTSAKNILHTGTLGKGSTFSHPNGELSTAAARKTRTRKPKTDPLAPEDMGYGIFHDRANKRYSIFQPVEESNEKRAIFNLLNKLFEEADVISKPLQMVFLNGGLCEEFIAPYGENKETEQKARTMIGAFITAHKQKGH